MDVMVKIRKHKRYFHPTKHRKFVGFFEQSHFSLAECDLSESANIEEKPVGMHKFRALTVLSFLLLMYWISIFRLPIPHNLFLAVS